MKFSILIANYNNGKYFRECYDSIIQQTHTDWEAIIVDDCSSDNSVQIIQEIISNDDRFTLFENAENKGTGFTKRKAAELASGEICGFLDPDDALTDHAIELSLKAYEKEKIVATYSKIMFCDENLKPKFDFKKVKKVYNDRYFFNLPIQIHHFFTYRNSIYKKTEGINPDLSSAVDQDLYLRILELGDVKFIPVNMYFYRRHNQGISQAGSKSKAKANFAKVIFDTFKRRKITKINGKNVPQEFTSSEEIFALLDYQNSIRYRVKIKLRLLLQKLLFFK